ncbi:MAG: hypothetical protein ACREU6_02835 [Steroidobacteraceae bacterium]
MQKRALHALFLGLVVTAGAYGTAAEEASTDASRIEATARQFFRVLQDYDFAGMRAAATPQFELLDQAARPDIAAFVAEMRDERQPQGFRYHFELSKFNTVVTPEVAYTIFHVHEIVTNSSIKNQDHSTDSTTCMILRRVGKRWLVDRLFHVPFRSEDEAKKGSVEF